MRNLIPWRRPTTDVAAERPTGELRQEMDKLFADCFGDDVWAPSFTGSRALAPAFDVAETEDDLLITAELPGMDAKDVDVNLTGNVLTVTGEKKLEKEEKNKRHHRVERSFGSFTRSFTLPCEVEADKVEATYKNGLLNLKLPKCEHEKKKAVKIEVK